MPISQNKLYLILASVIILGLAALGIVYLRQSSLFSNSKSPSISTQEASKRSDTARDTVQKFYIDYENCIADSLRSTNTATKSAGNKLDLSRITDEMVKGCVQKQNPTESLKKDLSLSSSPKSFINCQGEYPLTLFFKTSSLDSTGTSAHVTTQMSVGKSTDNAKNLSIDVEAKLVNGNWTVNKISCPK